MKAGILKKVLPIAVVAMAAGGAFSTHAMAGESALLTNKTGYEHVSQLQPCEARIECSTVIGDPCTYQGNQLYELINPVSCPNPLFKP